MQSEGTAAGWTHTLTPLPNRVFLELERHAGFAQQPGWGGGGGVGGLLFWKTRSLAALPLGEVSLQLGVHGWD